MKNSAGIYVYVGPEYESTLKLEQSAIGKTDYDLFPPVIARVYTDNDSLVLVNRQPIEVYEPFWVRGEEPKKALVLKFPIEYQEEVYVFGTALILNSEEIGENNKLTDKPKKATKNQKTMALPRRVAYWVNLLPIALSLSMTLLDNAWDWGAILQ